MDIVFVRAVFDCNASKNACLKVFEREPEQNIRHHRRLTARLADIGFICGIGRSVVALPPFLRRTPPRTANRPFPGTSEFDWQSSVWVGAAAPLTGRSMPLECFLTDRSSALDAPPSSSHLEMALLWFERFGFLFVIWLNPHDHMFRCSDRLRYMSCPV